MARLFFIRQTGDFIVDIKKVPNAISIEVKDTSPNDAFMATTTVATYEELLTYIEILFQQVFNDLYCDIPFINFQYNIDPFPSILIPICLLDEGRIRRFTNALRYHLL